MSVNSILTLLKDGAVVKAFPVQEEMSLGRADGCTIRLDDRAISRQHALFRVVGGDVQVEQKSEFAPLVVNGIECTSSVLKDGDTISVGPYMIRFSKQDHQIFQKSEGILPVQPVSSDPEPILPTEGSDHLGIGENESVQEAVPLETSLEQSAEPEGFHNGSSESLNSVPQLDLSGDSSGEDPMVMLDEDGKTKVTPLAKVTVKLIFKPGMANVEEYELTKDSITLGRGKDCDIVLTDKKSSRKNSMIQRAGLEFMIKDLESANGTFVNGVKVKEQALSGDDIVRVGNVEFQFKAMSTDYMAKEKDLFSLPNESIDSMESLGNGDFGAPSEVMAEVAAEVSAAGVSPVPEPSLSGLGFGGVPGLDGQTGSNNKNKTLLEKFKTLPKRTQIIVGIVAVVAAYSIFTYDDTTSITKSTKSSKSAKAVTGEKGLGTFESLSAEQKRFVENQHNLAFDYYKNKEYDKSLFEIQKIFTLVSDYKDAREIERYAKEGKRKLEALEEERQKKLEEERLKAKVAQLIDEIKIQMDQKHYDQAKELFSQVIALDPENSAISAWRKEIDSYEEELRQKALQEQVKKEISKHAWEVYQDALSLKKKRKYHTAINTAEKILDMGSVDKKLIALAKKVINQCLYIIKSLRDPLLLQAKKLEEEGSFLKAYSLYMKVTRVDPHHPTAYSGINRIKGILHERAKSIYTEAVLAESYSDFATARKMFQECLATAPVDDLYHDRAQRRLAHYFGNDALYSQDASVPADPSRNPAGDGTQSDSRPQDTSNSLPSSQDQTSSTPPLPSPSSSPPSQDQTSSPQTPSPQTPLSSPGVPNP